MEMTPRMKALASKHPRTVRELVKEINSKKLANPSLIAEAIETLNAKIDGEYEQFNEMLRKKSIREKIRIIYHKLSSFARIRIEKL